MTDLDIALRPVSRNLINKFGQAATLRREVREYNTATRKNEVVSTTNYAVKISPPNPFHERQINGTTILVGDIHAYLADLNTSAAPPLPGDEVVLIDGTEWKLVDFSTIYSGEQVAIYDLHLRS